MTDYQFATHRFVPEEAAWFVPEPCGGFAVPQSNDVDLDHRHLVDRNCAFDVLELERQARPR